MKRLPKALSTNPKSLPDRGNFCIRVALDVPLQKLFEYSLPEGISARVGDRVAVRFGAQQKIGVVLDDRARIYQFLDPRAVRELVQEHLDGRQNRRLLIWSLLSFESWCREFLP